MNRYDKLNYLANGIHAASKIRDIYKANLKEDPNSAVRASNTDIVNQVLNVIAQYAPEPYRQDVQTTVQKCCIYNDTYRNLKQHIRSTANHRMNDEEFIRTLDIVRPVVGNRERILIEKIIKIYQIIKS